MPTENSIHGQSNTICVQRQFGKTSFDSKNLKPWHGFIWGWLHHWKGGSWYNVKSTLTLGECLFPLKTIGLWCMTWLGGPIAWIHHCPCDLCCGCCLLATWSGDVGEANSCFLFNPSWAMAICTWNRLEDHVPSQNILSSTFISRQGFCPRLKGNFPISLHRHHSTQFKPVFWVHKKMAAYHCKRLLLGTTTNCTSVPGLLAIANAQIPQC